MRKSSRGNPWHDYRGRFCSGPKMDGVNGRYATDIVWDTDGEDVDLPQNVKIPGDIEEEEVADYLSDEYGWCVEQLNCITRSERADYEYRTCKRRRAQNPPPVVEAYIIGDDVSTIKTNEPQVGMVVEYDPAWRSEGEEKYIHVVKEIWEVDGIKKAKISTINSGLSLGSTEVVDLEMIRPVSVDRVNELDSSFGGKYKGVDISTFKDKDKTRYSVQDFNGDEVVFESREEAKKFIDEM